MGTLLCPAPVMRVSGAGTDHAVQCDRCGKLPIWTDGVTHPVLGGFHMSNCRPVAALSRMDKYSLTCKQEKSFGCLDDNQPPNLAFQRRVAAFRCGEARLEAWMTSV